MLLQEMVPGQVGSQRGSGQLYGAWHLEGLLEGVTLELKLYL